MARLVFIKAGHLSVRQHYSPPLGIMSLAAFLRERRPELSFKLLDMLPQELSVEEAVAAALREEPAAVGLSAMSYEAREFHQLAAGLKKRRPGLIVMGGGPYPSTAPERALEDPNLDVIVRGEAEETLLDLLPRLLAGEGPSEEVAGIGFRKDGRPVLTRPRDQAVDLNSLPLPAYDLIDLPRYWDRARFGTTFVHREYAVLSTSRACPYHCTYCHRIFGSRYRAQRPEIVLRDLAALHERFGVREVQFVDDCFNLEKKRVIAICRGLRDRGLRFAISFPNGLRGDIMDPELLDHLKAAGTYRITYAVETASPRFQKFLKKNLNLSAVQNIITETDRRDIMVDGFFMVGFPGETREEIQATLDFALHSRLHSANFWFVTPFPGTELYEQAKNMGLAVPENTDALHYFDPTTDLSHVPAAQLKKMVQKTFRRFYLNPWRLRRIFQLFPNKKQLPALFLRFLKFSLKWS